MAEVFKKGDIITCSLVGRSRKFRVNSILTGGLSPILVVTEVDGGGAYQFYARDCAQAEKKLKSWITW